MEANMKTLSCSIVLLLGVAAAAQDLVIQSFKDTGQITFNEIPDATSYRVEWAPSSEGPWTNFTGAYVAWLDWIPANRSGTVTASVPMVYRVVAETVEPDYLVIDLRSLRDYAGAVVPGDGGIAELLHQRYLPGVSLRGVGVVRRHPGILGGFGLAGEFDGGRRVVHGEAAGKDGADDAGSANGVAVGVCVPGGDDHGLQQREEPDEHRERPEHGGGGAILV
jgi:hypothetical protein